MAALQDGSLQALTGRAFRAGFWVTSGFGGSGVHGKGVWGFGGFGFWCSGLFVSFSCEGILALGLAVQMLAIVRVAKSCS